MSSFSLMLKIHVAFRIGKVFFPVPAHYLFSVFSRKPSVSLRSPAAEAALGQEGDLHSGQKVVFPLFAENLLRVYFTVLANVCPVF